MKCQAPPRERTVLHRGGEDPQGRHRGQEGPSSPTAKKGSPPEAMKDSQHDHPRPRFGREESRERDPRDMRYGAQVRLRSQDHGPIAPAPGLIDFDTAAPVSGSNSTTSRTRPSSWNSPGTLRHGRVRRKGFSVTITPDVAKDEVLEGIGSTRGGRRATSTPSRAPGTCWMGTAEITLGGYSFRPDHPRVEPPHQGRGAFPLFPPRGGSGRPYSKGLYRVHQFSKVEMFMFAGRGIRGAAWADARQPRRRYSTPSRSRSGSSIPAPATLGGPAYRKFDLEGLDAGRGENGDWGEVDVHVQLHRLSGPRVRHR
jgi:seryl-tRNA synthetase